MRLIDYAALFLIGAMLAAIAVLPRPHAPELQHQSPPPSVQELPDALVNAPADRLAGPDGHPLIDHSAGW